MCIYVFIYTVYMYINIYKYVLKTYSQCRRQKSVSLTLSLLHTLAGYLGGLEPYRARLNSGQHMYWTVRVVTDIYITCELTFICGQPVGICDLFTVFIMSDPLCISASRAGYIRGKEWWRTALYTFLALYTICYTSPLLNCYTQYSYHSLWVFI